MTNGLQHTVAQGRTQDLGLGSREYMGFETSALGGDVPLHIGSRNAYFGAFAIFEYLLLRCNTSRSRPPVRLSSLTFQADCGSIKGAGVPVEEGTDTALGI